MPYPGLLHPEPPPMWLATTDLYLGRRHSDTGLAQSLCGVSEPWCAQGLFELLECLWKVRGLILNLISPLVPSCWGFYFALGCQVSSFGGIQSSSVESRSAASCSFAVLTGEDDHMPFYSAILHRMKSLMTIQRK